MRNRITGVQGGRRSRPMGIFSDKISMERITYAVFAHENFKINPEAPSS
jgi:hypothetical protein